MICIYLCVIYSGKNDVCDVTLHLYPCWDSQEMCQTTAETQPTTNALPTDCMLGYMVWFGTEFSCINIQAHTIHFIVGNCIPLPYLQYQGF